MPGPLHNTDVRTARFKQAHEERKAAIRKADELEKTLQILEVSHSDLLERVVYLADLLEENGIDPDA
jgi:hypothetical protein